MMATTTKRIAVNPPYNEKETVTVVSKNSDSIGVLLNKTDLTSRKSLESVLNSHGEVHLPENSTKNLNINIVAGELVLALSQLSQPSWRRALILEVSSDSVLVDQIDYGYEETVPISNLRELPVEFLTWPAFAMILKVKPENFVVSQSYEVFLGKPADKFYRAIEASCALDFAPEPVVIENFKSRSDFISQNVKQVEKGCVNGLIVLNGHSTVYGVQHREGFEMMAAEIAELDLPLATSVQKGSFVIVPSNGVLCRAVVLSVENDSASILHVDFGWSETVPLSKLLALPPGMIRDTPHMSFLCSVENGESLEIDESYEFKTVSVMYDSVYPIHVCQVSKMAANEISIPKVEDLPGQFFRPVETVQVIDKQGQGDDVYATLVLSKYSRTAENIETSLRKSFIEASKINCDFQYEVGHLVISYINGVYLRSVVCEVSGNDVLVYTMDAGFFVICNFECLTPLPDEFLRTSPATFLCDFEMAKMLEVTGNSFQVKEIVFEETWYCLNVFKFELVKTVEYSSNCNEHEVNDKLCEAIDGLHIESFDLSGREEDSEKTIEAVEKEDSRYFKIVSKPVFPPCIIDTKTPLFIEVKIARIYVDDEGSMKVSLVFLDRQELIEEALSIIELPLNILSTPMTIWTAPGLVRFENSWARTVTVEKIDPDCYVVQLVDYGQRRTCNANEIFHCPAIYTEFPICTVEFEIIGAIPHADQVQILEEQDAVLKRESNNPLGLFLKGTGELLLTLKEQSFL